MKDCGMLDWWGCEALGGGADGGGGGLGGGGAGGCGAPVLEVVCASRTAKAGLEGCLDIMGTRGTATLIFLKRDKKQNQHKQKTCTLNAQHKDNTLS